MSERSTIYEVARRSGVSTATVSRVMHDGTGFSTETRDRVLSAAQELGWVPSGSARGLANRRSGIVGVLFTDIGASTEAEEESPLFVDEVIRGAERAAAAAGDALLIAATRGSAGRELAYNVAGKVDGLVVLAGSLAPREIATLARSVPVVQLGGPRSRTGLDSIGTDNRGGACAVVTHLIEAHGFTDIVFVGGPAGSADSRARFEGYRDALRTAGLAEPDRPHAEGGFTAAGGARAVSALLADRVAPQAVVCGNDEMALGALSALGQARLKVPGDVAVTGFDDIAAARHVSPALTTVRQPMRDLGEDAVRMLLDRIGDPTAPRRSLMLPTHTVIRRSCGCRTRAHRKPTHGGTRT